MLRLNPMSLTNRRHLRQTEKRTNQQRKNPPPNRMRKSDPEARKRRKSSPFVFSAASLHLPGHTRSVIARRARLQSTKYKTRRCSLVTVPRLVGRGNLIAE